MFAKRKRSEGVKHTFDSNGALTVNAYSLLKSAGFKKQLDAAKSVVVRTSVKEKKDDSRPLADKKAIPSAR